MEKAIKNYTFYFRMPKKTHEVLLDAALDSFVELKLQDINQELSILIDNLKDISKDITRLHSAIDRLRKLKEGNK